MARDARRDSSQLTEEVTALWSPLGRGQKDPRADRATLRAHALAQIAKSARGGRRASRWPRPPTTGDPPRRDCAEPARRARDGADPLATMIEPPTERAAVDLAAAHLPGPVHLPAPVDLLAPAELPHGSQSTPRLPGRSGASPLDRSALPGRRPVGSYEPLRSPPRRRAPARPDRPVVSVALLLLAVGLWSIAYCLAWIELDVSEHVRSAWHDLADVISAAVSGGP